MEKVISVVVDDYVKVRDSVDVTLSMILRHITSRDFAELLKRHGLPDADCLPIFDELRRAMEHQVLMGRADSFAVENAVKATAEKDVFSSAKLLAEMWLEGFQFAREQCEIGA